MGKHGPCFHCGIHSSPLWRNGPPEKPVLCNTCGSRYRLGRPLENYRPKAQHNATKRKREVVVESSSTSSSGYDASSESSPSHCPSPVTVKQEIPDDAPVENRRGSWRSHSRRTRAVSSGLSTIEKLQRDLQRILRDEFNGSIEPEGAEDVLIYNLITNQHQNPSTEIGLGAILLKRPAASPDHRDDQETRASPPDQAPAASP
ncbi:hypothetical protein V6N13_090188 [Hibiscus sabdariffa]|uniref:GATA-type domain-containing protein n=1 Tax=Hibiscus sabdariffa TaxID=183260 RepID=A0ABR2QHT4_9ROSI